MPHVFLLKMRDGGNYFMTPHSFFLLPYRVDLALVEPDVDVRVHERLVDVDPLLGVYDEHLGEKVAGLARAEPVRIRRLRGEEHVGEEALERVAWKGNGENKF